MDRRESTPPRIIEPVAAKHSAAGQTYKEGSAITLAFDAMTTLLPTGSVFKYDDPTKAGNVGVIVARDLKPYLDTIVGSPVLKGLAMVTDQIEQMPTTQNLAPAGWDDVTLNSLILYGLRNQADIYEALATDPSGAKIARMGVHVNAQPLDKKESEQYAHYAKQRRGQAEALAQTGVVPLSTDDIHSLILNEVTKALQPVLAAQS